MNKKTGRNQIPKSNKAKASTTGRKGRGMRDQHSQRSDNRNVNSSGNYNGDIDAPATNNPDWWNKSATFADSVRIPFNRITGYPISKNDLLPRSIFQDTTIVADESYPEAIAIPNLMCIHYIPFTGACSNWNDPINRSYMSVYSALAAKTSGAMQINQPDLAMTTEAANSVIVLIYELKRALGIANLYSQQNKTLPYHVLQALHIDPDSIIGHQDEIRRELNYYIGALNSLALPAYTDIHARRAQLAGNVYADEDDVRAAFYAYVTAGYYEYVDTADDISDVEHLKFVYMAASTPRTADSYLTAIGDCINAIRNSSAFGLISAAVQRGFGDRNLLTVEMVPVDFVVIPAVDRYMTYQTQNADFIGHYNDLDSKSLHIVQNPVRNALEVIPTIKSNSSHYPENWACIVNDNKWLNSYDGITDADFVIEATRLKVATTAIEDPGFEYGMDIPLDVTGTEICLNFHIWKVEIVNGKETLTATIHKSWNYVANADPVAMATQVKFMCNLSKFKNHPLINFILKTDDVVKTGVITPIPFGDLYRYTIMSGSALQGIHETALQSIYTLVPSLDIVGEK
ncbi:capsid protein [Picobirnavirus sp.]|uniref:capsid protein n=1 Tax=Picobirnavirus sp. TaxID=1907787 RepID=UPI000C020DD1|nr:capsid protein [Picobirnavirus sp.]ATL73070.1 capsid protein [Picobirnavirus sp.]